LTLREDVRRTWRFARGLQRYWRAPIALPESGSLIRRRLEQREATFLDVLHRTVFLHAASPYLWLLRTAGVEEPDVARLVAEQGIEGALDRLHGAGVYVTLEEFKGNTPVMRRGSQERPIAAADFDNPLSAGHLRGSSGGTRSRGTPLAFDLDDLLDELPARYLHLEAYGMVGMPIAMWRPAPPGLAALRMVLISLKAGSPLLRWFSQTQPGPGLTAGKSAYLTWAALLASRLQGRRIPYPQYVPMDRPETVARWLAGQTARGRRVPLYVMANTGARVCLAARDLGLDISGHMLRTTSEPLTEAKATLYTQMGLSYSSAYGMTEAGGLALSCADPVAVDDMHLLTYRMACIQRPLTFTGFDEPVGSLWYTVFASTLPKVMLNVESGDHGVLFTRACACSFGRAGLHQHLRTIRSYEKLTSAGMSFMGSALLDVLETALPARYGGGPTDYQFVESEIEGETVVRLVIAPGIGPLDEGQVIAYTLEELARRTRAGRMQTQIWRDSDTLRVERAQPYLTPAVKIQPLHVERQV
jgi:hypothetical protein